MPTIVNGVECRTREESLKRIVAQINAGKVGPRPEEMPKHSCEYRYPSGNHCAIGCLLSAEQLDYIAGHELNEMTASYAAKWIGKSNLETVTGMQMVELSTIQKIHDTNMESTGATAAIGAVKAYCEQELKKLEVA